MHDIREMLYRQILPGSRFVQYLLTMLSGKPYKGQKLPRHSASGLMLRLLVVASLGFGAGVFAVMAAQWWLLPISWITMVYVMRYSQVPIIHYCAHLNVLGAKRDPWLGRILSWLLMIPPFPVYRAKHLREHHARGILSSAADPSVEYLKSQGLESGLSVRQLKWRVFIALISPINHLYQFSQRVLANFSHGWASALGFVAALMAHVLLAVLIGWQSYILVIALPLTVFYQQSYLLRFIVEHWRAPSADFVRDEKNFANLTSAIFLGAAPPQAVNRTSAGRAWLGWALLGWTRLGWVWLDWIGRMLAAMFVRVCILNGDNVVHDYHHMRPRTDWPNAIELRQQHVDELTRQGKQDLYSEVWGYRRAFNLSLASISQSTV